MLPKLSPYQLDTSTNVLFSAYRESMDAQSSILRVYEKAMAVGAPVVPTVLWAFSTQRGGTDPLYNIGALLRGCCVVALHSLRRTTEHIKT